MPEPKLNADLLKRLCETPGIPGREERVASLIRKEVEGMFDEFTTDPMGSLICKRSARGSGGGTGGGQPKRVMIAAHMDEIGFYVKYIDDKGFIRVNPAGGFDTRNLFSRRVLICTKSHGDILGVMNPGGRPVHIATEEDKKKVPDIKEFFIDIGRTTEEVKSMVRVGDMVVLHEPFIEVGNKFVSKAIDNRFACWLAIEAVRALHDSKTPHACDIYAAFTVQEEVGLRGAKTASAFVKPDIGIGLDVSLACDTPGVPEDEAVNFHGKGAGLHVMDGSIISDYTLINELEEVANSKGIKAQRSILARGGQDGGAMQQTLTGSRAAGLVCGTRYIHTVTEMIDKNDLAAARDLLAAWLPTVK